MQSLTNAYFSFPARMTLLVVPILIAIIGAVAGRMAKRRWIAHTLAFTAMFFTVPAYIWVGAILDPYSIELPGPLDGFFYFICMCIALLTMLVYAVCLLVFTVLSRRRRRSDAFSPA